MFTAQESYATWISPSRISGMAYRSGAYVTIILVAYIDNYASKLNEGLRQELIHNSIIRIKVLMSNFVHM